jgi:hypothetical protein
MALFNGEHRAKDIGGHAGDAAVDPRRPPISVKDDGLSFLQERSNPGFDRINMRRDMKKLQARRMDRADTKGIRSVMKIVDMLSERARFRARE